MKIVIASDSFKGSLTSLQAGNAISEGIKKVFKDADISVCPIADGGEGTVEAIASLEESKLQKVTVCGPLGNPVAAEYAIVKNTAVIEMSSASGIMLLNKNELNPLNTTTYGVGEIIKDAITKGCRNFIMGIGGSATNDGGTGMLTALGFEFTDINGKSISCNGQGLKDLYKINIDNAIEQLKDCEFQIACDVTNPLCGEMGCSAVYGPQKGATPSMIEDMDNWLEGFAELTQKINPKANPNTPGAGAAGGMGYAFLSYLKGSLQSGIDLIIKETKTEEKIKDADIVITGEGRLDGQSIMGKVPVGIAKYAKKYNKPVIAFAGSVTEDAKILNQYGIDAYFPILKDICSPEEAMENAYNNLADTTEQVFNLIKKLP